MTTARTLEYPHEPPRRRSRRTTLIVTAVIVVATLLVGFIAADRVVDFTTEQKIAAGLEPYGDADVNVEGFPVLTQMAGGTLDTVRVTADRAQYENVDFTDVDAELFDVPVDTSRPIGTVDASAVIPLSTIDSLATEHASLPDGMSFTTIDGGLYLKGSLLGQDLLIGIESKAQSRRVVVNATTIRLGSAEVDIDSLPSFLTSSISDIVIDLDFLPAGLELTDIESTDAGLKISLHGTGISLN
ncbi:LmeA family phospholipid-binding protein [Brevibacterium sp. UCMA 11752]|uniref:LmeA family phospholipid-binding protein n=1 Tax=Brevibacterium sp. UCMA 11752 TaxID=2745946 RepID=UPI001F203637|nr:DUF2993 domain-containing protein [Brevibacterium sp. UCMA 11752]MCF2587520.1 DUF2993 domain-containing protein [Brevibacterium sp. UCMA 11752]